MAEDEEVKKVEDKEGKKEIPAEEKSKQEEDVPEESSKEEEDIDVEEESKEESEDEEEESDKLASELKQALENAKNGDMKSVTSILANVIKNVSKFSIPNPEDAKTLKQAQELLEKAATDLEERNNEISELKTEVSKLKKYEDTIKKLSAAKQDKAVDKLVNRKLSLGLIKNDDVTKQKEMLRKLSVSTVNVMVDELDNVKSSVRKETLKGSEISEKEDVKNNKLRQMMINAGIEEKSVDEYFKNKE